MQRIDEAHSQPTAPHPVQIPYDKLQELFSMLEQREIDLADFAGRIIQYPVIHSPILMAANSGATGRKTNITDPAHAAAYLGSRRLINLLQSMSNEVSGTKYSSDAA